MLIIGYNVHIETINQSSLKDIVSSEFQSH